MCRDAYLLLTTTEAIPQQDLAAWESTYQVGRGCVVSHVEGMSHVCHHPCPGFPVVYFELSRDFQMWERVRSWGNAGNVDSDGKDPFLATCLFEQVAGLGGGIMHVECGALYE